MAWLQVNGIINLQLFSGKLLCFARSFENACICVIVSDLVLRGRCGRAIPGEDAQPFTVSRVDKYPRHR